jgi:hypothetical protein
LTDGPPGVMEEVIPELLGQRKNVLETVHDVCGGGMWWGYVVSGGAWLGESVIEVSGGGFIWFMSLGEWVPSGSSWSYWSSTTR